MLRIAADRSPIRIPSYRVILSEVEGSAAVLSEIVRSSLLSIPQSRVILSEVEGPAAVLSEIVRSSLLSIPQSRVILSEARLGPRERRESSVG
jgi:ABC-type amino acid transport system permease subunit